MFAALSIKTTLFTVLLISLASISIAQEDKPIKFTLSIQKSIHHPEADIEFERTDSNIKWFNDNSISTNSDLIFGSTIPLNQINLNRDTNINSVTAANLDINILSLAEKNSASKAVVQLKEALQKLSGIRARLGATQNRLTRAINTQLSAAQNLTAAGATMKDADMASEFAHLTKESILVQSSSAMIGQANLFPQGVIQLLP